MYEFVPGQAAIVTEIYLPAKYVISPTFLAALDNSLLPERVVEHFDDQTLAEEIKGFLPEKLGRRYTDLRDGIRESRRCFGGYSIYDLKGAWKTTANTIERDANACIRLVDWPTPDVLFPPESPLFQRVIRTVFALRQHHDARPEILSSLQGGEGAIDEVCKALDKWIDEGSFVLYGFVMYHLGRITGRGESEILMTSYFAVVNRYRQREHPSVKPSEGDPSTPAVSTVAHAESGAGDAITAPTVVERPLGSAPGAG
jgi:hypothetical protein